MTSKKQNNDVDFWVIIPARLKSTRFPEKMLAEVLGKPMINRVAEKATISGASRVIVATDSEKIKAVVSNQDVDCIMTSIDHPTGSDRICEAIQKSGAGPRQIIVNLQGDEPLTKPEWIDDMIEYGVDRNIDVLQSSRKLEPNEIEDEDVVKMILNNGVVTHMQRKCDVICDNIVTQLGLYMYKREVIIDFKNCDMTFVRYWNGLDTIGFCGKYDVIPYDLRCGKVRAVDRPHHIDEVESNL